MPSPIYMPGDTTALVKAELAATDAPNTKVSVYFNPKEITIDKQVAWQIQKNSSSDTPTLEFTSGSPKSLACELMFDMFEDKGDVYDEYISKLETLALMDAGTSRPPLCTFTWGNRQVFQGVVEDLNVKYTMFLPDGTPCRATVNLKMKQAESLLNKKDAAEAAKNKTAKGTTTDGSKNASQVAHETGHDDARSMGKTNNIDDLNNIPPGTNVRGPQKQGY